MEYNCECATCKNNLPFEIPEDLFKDLLNEKLVIFAGAGVSTEGKNVFKNTLYSDIADELNLENTDLEFSKLMTKFCKSETNGNLKLLEKIRKRFDYCYQFQEVYRNSTRFHNQLAPIWLIKNIITTNWDDFFEKECDAIPMITAQDLCFMNTNKRKVFKIHGSISNYGSIVATEEDYKKRYESLNNGGIGSQLKNFLLTKTVVFIGYSFRDKEFLKIYDILHKEMKGNMPHIYIVSLNKNITPKINTDNTTIIHTDGSNFLDLIKQRLINEKKMFPGELLNVLDHAHYFLGLIHSETSELFLKYRSPSVIFCMFYQDGISHALDYLKHKSKSGEAYDPFHILDQIHIYEKHIRPRYSKIKNYMEIAYIDGYIEGLKLPFWEENEYPFFYAFGKGNAITETEFQRVIKKKEIYHKSAEKYGQQFFKKYMMKSSDVVPHHRPFL